MKPTREDGGGTVGQPAGRLGGAPSLLLEPPLAYLAAVLLAVFMASRIPYFWYYPVVRMAQDTNGYLDLVDAIREGRWPHFVFRTPGYPAFFWLATLFTGRWMAVIYAQNLLSYAASLFLVHAVSRYRRSLALPATLAMCGYLGSSQVVLYDVALLSESLYTNTIILAVAFLVLAFGRPDWSRFAAASALMAFAILVRPAGIYFGAIYAVVLAFLAWNRFPARSIVAFLVPFPAILLGLCTYNFATISSFAITMGGETNLAGATALIWEADPRLPPSVNSALRDLPGSYARQDITAADLAVLRTSWDAGLLFPIYAKAYNRLVWSEGWGDGKRFGARDYVSSRDYIRQVSLMAIRRHPILYGKFVWVNLVEFFKGVGYTFDIRSALAYREKGNPGDATVRASSPQQRPARDAGAGRSSQPSGLERCVTGLQLAWQGLHGALFQSVVWSWALLGMFALGAARLIRSHGRHAGAFLLLVLTLIPVGSSLVVCLTEIAADRYSYPTQFLYYLSVALASLAWGPPKGSPDGEKPGAQGPP